MRVLLLVPNTSYRGELFLEACRRMGVEVRVAVDACHTVAEHYGVPLAFRFREEERTVRGILAHARQEPFDAVIPTDDLSTVVASRVAAALGLPANSRDAAYAARNKAVMRERLWAARVPAPGFRALEARASLARFAAAAADLGYPLVVKPLLLSGSRGVIRADDPAGLAAAVERVRRILRAADVPRGKDPAARRILLERFIPGVEVALEGLLDRGRLRTLALFDKPDPLDGPFFEETLYVTPSRLGAAVQEAIRATTERAARAIGLETGPVHAELRVNPKGVWPIEVAGRSIGGLCSRTLRFGTGYALEDLILAQALGRPLPAAEREARAAGVLMIPIPKRGLLRAVKGVDEARALPGVEAVEITAKLDHEIVPLPEGSSYLGFVFARAGSPAGVESALRAAHRCLEPVIAPNLALKRER